MPITKLPGVYYTENVEFELVGEGSKIPVFIGYTGNKATNDHKTDGTQILTYSRWSEVNATVEKGGLGAYTDDTTNLLLKTLKEFFEESALTTSADVGVPYIYVIDLGDATSKDNWLTALSTAKAKAEATVEVYVGEEKISGDYKFTDFLEAAYTSIITESHALKLKIGLTTKFDVADDITSTSVDKPLIALTNNESGIQRRRISIIEPYLFGKTVARICLTPYNIEPGFYEYRSVTPGTFIDRTPAEQLALQDAGIIFNRDEVLTSETYPKINLAVTTAFASNPRPADALLHARCNADNLLLKVFDTIYPQIKNNETATNFSYLQTQIDKLIDDEIEAENMIKYDEKTGEGTRLLLAESDNDPYDAILSGQIQPVNCTVAIEVQAELKAAAAKAVQK